MNIRTKRAQLSQASRRLQTLSYCDKSSPKAIQHDKDRSYKTQQDHKKAYDKYNFYDKLIKAMEKKEEII